MTSAVSKGEMTASSDAELQEFLRDALDETLPIDSLVVENGRIAITLRPDASGRERLPSEAELSSMLERLIDVSRSLDHGVMHEHHAGRMALEAPDRVLAARGDLFALAPGLFTCAGPFLATMRGLDRMIEALGRHCGAVEQDLPGLWPVDLFARGHLFADAPDRVVLGAGLQPTRQARRSVAGAYTKDNQVESVPLDASFAPARYGLPPSLSLACHYALQNRGTVGNAVFNVAGKIVRRARPKSGRIEDAVMVSRRELLAVGTELFVRDLRESWLDEVVDLVGHLDLDCRIEKTAETGEGGTGPLRQVFQQASGLRYEVLATVPQDGRRISVMALTLHLDGPSRAFGYTLEDGTPAHAGTLSVDLEPFAYALMAQYGPDLAGWPQALRRALGIVGATRIGA